MIAVIPSRYHSKRFPGKSHTKILGVPMLQRIIENVCEVLPQNSVYVLTEDEETKALVDPLGYQCLLDKRPASSGLEKVIQLVNKLPSGLILHVQGDEPLLTSNHIRTFMEHSLGPLHQAIYLSDKPKGVTLVTGGMEEVLYYSRSPIPHNARIYKNSIGMFLYSTTAAMCLGENQTSLALQENIEMLNFIERGYQPITTTIPKTTPVDYPRDIKKVESILR